MLVGLALVWGGSFLFIRVLLDGDIDPLGVSAARLAVGVIVLSPVAYALRGQLPGDVRTWSLLAFMGIVNFAVPWTLIPLGQQHIPSGVASIANSCTPLWASLFAATLMAGERLTARRVAGLALGISGVGVLVVEDVAGVGAAGAWGIFAVVLSTVLYGASVVFIRTRLPHVPPIGLAFGQIGSASIVMVPAALLAGSFEGASLGAREWSSLLVLGAFGSAIGPMLYMTLITELGPVRASVVTYLIPPVGVFLGWLALDEPLGWHLLAALALIISGVALVQNVPVRAFPRWAYRRITFASSPIEP